MFSGAFALLERSLRVDARSWSTHLARLGLIGGIYIWLCSTLSTQFSFGAPGLRFFNGIAYLDAVFMTLLGISFFSTAITEEKEEDTLGLIMMAGVGPLGILAGKSGGRLWQALLLVAVQYPFLLLAITMGGITSGQIWAMTVALLSYMVFLSGYGLFCSTIAANGRRAGILMIIGIVAYVGTSVLAKSLVWLHNVVSLRSNGGYFLNSFWYSVLDGIGELCVFVRMNAILASGFSESAFNLQVFSNIAAGLMFAGLAWLFFDIATRSPSTETTTRGLVAQHGGFLKFTAGKSWENPFIWKDFHFAAGGIGMLLVRTAFYLGLGVILFNWERLLGLNKDVWVEIYLIWIMMLLPIDAALLVARSMQDEIRGQTLSSLMMLPRSPHQIVYSKFAGALMGWAPGPMIGFALLVGTDYGRRALSELNHYESCLATPVVVLYFAMIPHFAALLALYVRWGAVPLAVGLTFGVYLAIVFVVLTFLMLTGGRGGLSGPNGFTVAMCMLGVLFALINGACQFGVLLRVQKLGSK